MAEDLKLQCKIECLADQGDFFEGAICDFKGPAETITRLKELGFLEGDLVRIAGKAPLGGPLLVEVRGAVLALRREEAQCILV